MRQRWLRCPGTSSGEWPKLQLCSLVERHDVAALGVLYTHKIFRHLIAIRALVRVCIFRSRSSNRYHRSDRGSANFLHIFSMTFDQRQLETIVPFTCCTYLRTHFECFVLLVFVAHYKQAAYEGYTMCPHDVSRRVWAGTFVDVLRSCFGTMAWGGQS